MGSEMCIRDSTGSVLESDAGEIASQVSALINARTGKVVVSDIGGHNRGDRAVFVKVDVVKLAGMGNRVSNDLCAKSVIDLRSAAV